MKTTTLKKLVPAALVHLSLLLFTSLVLSAHADGIPASAYVQDGLVVCFDGIENAGAGQHSSDLTEWVNLATADGRCGNAYPSDGSYTVKTDSISFVKGRMVASNLVCATSSTPITLQARARATSAPSTAYDLMYVNVSSRGGIGFDARTNYGYAYYHPKNSSWGSQTSIYKWWGTFNFAARAYDKHTVTAIIPVSSDKTASVGKVYQENSAQTFFSSWESGTAAAPNGNVYIGHTGVDYEMYSVRVYNRELTTAEIAYNELVDRIRFENLAGYRWNSETSKLECRVSFAASDGDRGSVAATVGGEPAGASPFWAPIDVTVTLTPTPASGYKFVRWIGDTDGVAVDANGVATFSGAARDLTAFFVEDGADPVDRSWSGAGNKFDWFDGNNWSPVGVPARGDFVTIGSGKTVVLTNSTAALSSFTTASKLVCSNWMTKLEAVNVTVKNGGYLTVTNAFTHFQMSNRVWIVCRNLDLQTGGKINVDKLGYIGTNGPAWRACTSISGAYGGSYGGLSSNGSGSSYSKTYGSVAEPTDPGCGGLKYGASQGSYSKGGGAIRIEASGDVVVDGSIAAGGDSTAIWSCGGGSGGGVYISARTVSGSGSVSAIGWNQTTANGHAAGGGGRIAVHYDPAAQAERDAACNLRFNAAGGFGSICVPHPASTTDEAGGYIKPYTRVASLAGLGSLYFTDNRFLTNRYYQARGLKFSGVWHSGEPLPKKLVLPGSFSMNSSRLAFEPQPEEVTVDGDLEVSGEYTPSAGFDLTNAVLNVVGNCTLNGGARLWMKYTDVNIGGDFTMTGVDSSSKGSQLTVYAASTNGLDRPYGAEVRVGGTWKMDKYAVVYPYCDANDGSIVYFDCDNFDMWPRTRFDAAQKGYGVKKGPGYSGSGGASHAGKGGATSTNNYLKVKPPYGSYKRPLTAGSGSGQGFLGGGVVRVNARNRMDFNGTVIAHGNGWATTWQLGTAGGSVYLSAHKFSATNGVVALRGGGSTQYSCGSGSGGRAAFWANAFGETNVTVDVRGGGPHVNEIFHAAGGTVYWHQIHGTMLILR